MAILTAAYGRNYADELRERVQLLFGMVREKNWSKERFIATARWIVENRPYRDWTPADWFSAPQKTLFGYTKYMQLVHEKGKQVNSELTKYDLQGEVFWSFSDSLPFPKFVPVKPVAVSPPVETSDEPFNFSDFAEKFKEQPIRENKVRSLDELLDN